MFKILQVGPSKDLQGGVASVIKTYSDNFEIFKDEGYVISFFYTYPFKGWREYVRFIVSIFNFMGCAWKYDVLHFHVASKGSFYRKFTLFLISKLMRKKIVFHLHGAAFFEYMDSASFVIHRAIIYFLKHSDMIMTVSSEFKRQLELRLGGRTSVEVVGNSSPEFEDIVFDQSVMGCGKYILFCGRLTADKGLEELLSAVSILKRSNRPVDLVVAGNGNLEFWRKIAKTHDIEDKVHFAGWVNGREKISLYLKSVVFCLPSHVESFGISALEAMLSKKPLVCTRLGGFLDLVTHGENGFLVTPGSAEELAECIHRLTSDQQLAESMGQAGFNKAISCFTTKAAMDKTISMYDKITKI